MHSHQREAANDSNHAPVQGVTQMNETTPDEVMTVKEVADYLRLAESTVYRLVKKGSLPGRKLGGNWRFSRRGIDRWLAEVKTEPDLPQGIKHSAS